MCGFYSKVDSWIDFWVAMFYEIFRNFATSTISINLTWTLQMPKKSAV